MHRVLVVGINYAPEHTGIAPYTTQACNFLAEQGNDLLVLAGVPHYPHWTTPDDYRRCLRRHERHGDVNVRRLRHTVPAEQTAKTRALYELTFGIHVLGQRLPWRPDVVLAVVPSLAGAAAAAALARRHRARLVLWVQDLVGPATAQSGMSGGSRLSAATTRLENWVLRQADKILVLNDAFRRYVTNAGVDAARVKVMPNWTHVGGPTRDRMDVRAELGWGNDEVVALHSGNMGFKQALDNVVAAARLASRTAPQVRFVLMGDGNQRRSLQELGRDVSNLEFLPPASSDDFPDVLAAADVLLVNERASVLDMSLPSKLTSYFRAGMPVIAAVPGLGGTAREVARSKAGVVVEPEDAQALLRGVVELTSDVNLLQTLKLAAGAHAREALDSGTSLKVLTAAVEGDVLGRTERTDWRVPA